MIDRSVLFDLLESAWGIIANVGGHPKNDGWESQGEEWREATKRWRDNYYAVLAGEREPPAPAALALVSDGTELGNDLAALEASEPRVAEAARKYDAMRAKIKETPHE